LDTAIRGGRKPYFQHEDSIAGTKDLCKRTRAYFFCAPGVQFFGAFQFGAGKSGAPST
jgi:hypothetical protein